MLPSGLDLNRCVEGGSGLQLTTRLEAIQLYPYHPGLGTHSGKRFPSLSLYRHAIFPSGFPLQVGRLTSQVHLQPVVLKARLFTPPRGAPCALHIAAG